MLAKLKLLMRAKHDLYDYYELKKDMNNYAQPKRL